MNQYSFILRFGNIVAISFIAFALYVILQLKRVCSNEWKNINSVAKCINLPGDRWRRQFKSHKVIFLWITLYNVSQSNHRLARLLRPLSIDTLIRLRNYEHYLGWAKPYLQFLTLFIRLIE